MASEIWQFDPTPKRTTDDWRACMVYLVSTLGEFLHTDVRLEDHWINDESGNACSSICGRVNACVCRPLNLTIQGVIGMYVNHGESVNVSADILLFSEGNRIAQHKSFEGMQYRELFAFEFEQTSDHEGRWMNLGFVIDEFDEWQHLQHGPTCDVL